MRNSFRQRFDSLGKWSRSASIPPRSDEGPLTWRTCCNFQDRWSSPPPYKCLEHYNVIKCCSIDQVQLISWEFTWVAWFDGGKYVSHSDVDSIQVLQLLHIFRGDPDWPSSTVVMFSENEALTLWSDDGADIVVIPTGPDSIASWSQYKRRVVTLKVRLLVKRQCREFSLT
jgi:hypothetical protein